MKKFAATLGLVLLIALSSFASGVGGTTEPLSLGLVSFSGYSKGAEVVLEWETMSWASSRMFTIERSADGISWSTIREQLSESGGTTNARYSMTDEAPLRGYAFYRIGLSNDMGEHALSSPVRIYNEGGGAGSIALGPNPCTDVIRLGGMSAGSTIVVRNGAGQEMFRSTSGEGLSIGTGSWQSGTYFVTIATPGGSVFQNRFVRR